MNMPTRKCIDHRGPLSVRVADAVYFITIAAAERGTDVLVFNADVILSAVRFYQTSEKWFLHLFLVMPDHIHVLVHIPPSLMLADVVGHWKSYLTTQHGIRFQSNFFDTRIRNQEHFAEKWNYVCMNPVARGLATAAREWPHSIAFDPATGRERPHRSLAVAARPESAPCHGPSMSDDVRHGHVPTMFDGVCHGRRRTPTAPQRSLLT